MSNQHVVSRWLLESLEQIYVICEHTASATSEKIVPGQIVFKLKCCSGENGGIAAGLSQSEFHVLAIILRQMICNKYDKN